MSCFDLIFRVVANFITWFVIHDYAPYLSSKFHDVYLAFARVAYGIKKSSPLWRRCVRGTDASLDMGVSMLFIKDGGFSNESRQHVSVTKRFLKYFNKVQEQLTRLCSINELG